MSRCPWKTKTDAAQRESGGANVSLCVNALKAGKGTHNSLLSEMQHVLKEGTPKHPLSPALLLNISGWNPNSARFWSFRLNPPELVSSFANRE